MKVIDYRAEARDHLVPLQWFFVEYIHDDRLGELFAWISLCPMAILISFVALIGVRRDVQLGAFFAGIFFNEAVNMALKLMFRAQRPTGKTHRIDYGMPSSHAQFMSCFATIFILTLLHRVRFKRPYLWKGFISVGVIALTALVSISRMYLGYHTANQVIVGTAAGIISGFVWYSSTSHPQVQSILWFIVDSKLGHLLMLRDSSYIPSMMHLEYDAFRDYVQKLKNNQGDGYLKSVVIENEKRIPLQQSKKLS